MTEILECLGGIVVSLILIGILCYGILGKEVRDKEVYIKKAKRSKKYKGGVL